MNVNEGVVPNLTRKNIGQAETNFEEPRVKPLVESHAHSHVEPNVERSAPTSSELQLEPSTKPDMDIPIFDIV